MGLHSSLAQTGVMLSEAVQQGWLVSSERLAHGYLLCHTALVKLN